MPWMPAGESHRPWQTEHGSRFDRNIFRIISQLDAAEFINVSKDDALAFPNVVHRTYPAPTTAAIPMAVAPFVRKSLEINNTLLRIFNDKLGLPEGTLQRLHSPEEHSGSEARVIRVPPISGKALADKATLGAHTDFGSLVNGDSDVPRFRPICQLSSVVFTQQARRFASHAAWSHGVVLCQGWCPSFVNFLVLLMRLHRRIYPNRNVIIISALSRPCRMQRR